MALSFALMFAVLVTTKLMQRYDTTLVIIAWIFCVLTSIVATYAASFIATRRHDRGYRIVRLAALPLYFVAPGCLAIAALKNVL